GRWADADWRRHRVAAPALSRAASRLAALLVEPSGPGCPQITLLICPDENTVAASDLLKPRDIPPFPGGYTLHPGAFRHRDISPFIGISGLKQLHQRSNPGNHNTAEFYCAGVAGLHRDAELEERLRSLLQELQRGENTGSQRPD